MDGRSTTRHGTGALREAATPAADQPRLGRLVESLRTLFHDVSGHPVADITSYGSFLELGFDSLTLSHASQAIEKKFGVRVALRPLLEEL